MLCLNALVKKKAARISRRFKIITRVKKVIDGDLELLLRDSGGRHCVMPGFT